MMQFIFQILCGFDSAPLAAYLLICIQLCNLASKLHRAYGAMQFSFQISLRANSAPLWCFPSNLRATLQICLPNFTVHMPWCSLSSKLPGVAIRWHRIRMPLCSLSPKLPRMAIMRHIAVYLRIFLPLCNLASKFHRAYGVMQFSFQISLRANSAPLRCLSSNLHATLQIYLPNFTVHMTWCSLSSNIMRVRFGSTLPFIF